MPFQMSLYNVNQTHDKSVHGSIGVSQVEPQDIFFAQPNWTRKGLNQTIPIQAGLILAQSEIFLFYKIKWICHYILGLKMTFSYIFSATFSNSTQIATSILISPILIKFFWFICDFVKVFRP